MYDNNTHGERIKIDVSVFGSMRNISNTTANSLDRTHQDTEYQI